MVLVQKVRIYKIHRDMAPPANPTTIIDARWRLETGDLKARGTFAGFFRTSPDGIVLLQHLGLSTRTLRILGYRVNTLAHHY
jgi:hypothetical protein